MSYFWHAASIFLKTINAAVLAVSACIYCHRTTNCSEIATGRMHTCVINGLSIAISTGGIFISIWLRYHWAYKFTFISTVLITAVGIATGRISLPHCYNMIVFTKLICIFIDCTCIEIITNIRVKFMDRVTISTGRMCMFLDISVIETATDLIGLYF